MSRCRRVPRRAPAGLIAAVFLLFPSAAHAHSPIRGAGDFINGVVHPLATPAHLFVLLALALLLGQHWPQGIRTSVGVFAAVTGSALAVTEWREGWEIPEPAVLAIALLVAALVAVGKPLSPILSSALFGTAGLVLGLDSGLAPEEPLVAWKVLAGTWIAALAVVFNLGFYLSLCTREWMKIGIRVLGSWILAITFLALAFALKG